MPKNPTGSKKTTAPTEDATTTKILVVGVMRNVDTCDGPWDPVDPPRPIRDGEVICHDEPDFIPTTAERRVIIRRRAT